MTHGSGGLSVVVRGYFHGERLLSNSFGDQLALGPVPKERSRDSTYLRLEHAILAPQMLGFVEHLYSEWSINSRWGRSDVRGYPRYQGGHKTGVMYTAPLQPTSGVYIIGCGPINNGLHSGPFFVMKIIRSRGLEDHTAASEDVEPVEFMFGLAMSNEDTKLAEPMLLAKLTELGFAWPIVIHFPAYTYDTFKFNEISLSLVHDVVCNLWRTYSPFEA